MTVTSAAGEFSIRRAHGAPLESLRLRFVFLFSFFLFHFGGRLVVSSFSRPTERKPKRERGVCSSRGRIQPYRTSRRLPPRCKGFGFGFDARRRLLLLLFSSLNAPFARTMVVFVVGIFCARELLTRFSRRSRLVAKRSSNLFTHRRTQTNKRTKRERER